MQLLKLEGQSVLSWQKFHAGLFAVHDQRSSFESSCPKQVAINLQGLCSESPRSPFCPSDDACPSEGSNHPRIRILRFCSHLPSQLLSKSSQKIHGPNASFKPGLPLLLRSSSEPAKLRSPYSETAVAAEVSPPLRQDEDGPRELKHRSFLPSHTGELH